MSVGATRSPRGAPVAAGNAAWLERSLAAVWHPCTQMKAQQWLPLVPIARADGAWLEDFDGRRLLDAVSSWWVNLFGHGEPRIRAAIADQLATLEHAMLAGFTHAPAVELAERLAAIAPARLGHAFYASDGASATEIALKMSFHAWRNAGRPQKRSFVSLEGSYHGETLGALSVTDVALFRETYEPLLMRNATVPTPDARRARGGRSPADVAHEAAEALDRHLARHHRTTAAVVVEPLVQGASGMVMYDASYLARARASCTRHGVHLIADEIMTGFGRTGTMFACEQAGVAPDFLLLSKGITGGFLPLACVLTTDEVYAAFWDDDPRRGFLHSHSYTGNPLACRAALAVLDVFRDDDVIASNREAARRRAPIDARLAAHPRVRDFRRTGTIVAFEVDTDRADFARYAFAAGLERGILLRPIGRTVYFMPPYVVTDDEYASLVERTREIVEAA
ncbi:MAG: adenosylmethionine--8-amino-7-oxononanoate transaminase [Burkholderiales bacterium]